MLYAHLRIKVGINALKERNSTMKKVLQIIMAVTLLSGVAVGTAEAAVNCTIRGTGPGSTNTCTYQNDDTVDYTCNIDGSVTNDNDQTVTSGEAAVIDNTNGGGASSGDVSNSNSTLTELVASCAAAVCNDDCSTDNGGNPTTPPAPNPTPTPTPNPTTNPTPTPPAVGGMGGGEVSSAVTTAPRVAALPETGENDALLNAAAVTGGIGTLAVLAQLGTVLYRRRALNG